MQKEDRSDFVNTEGRWVYWYGMWVHLNPSQQPESMTTFPSQLKYIPPNMICTLNNNNNYFCIN